MKFIHTSDWQIGKPFNRILDHEKREKLKQQRIDAAQNLKDIILQNDIDFVLIAGDLFDSPMPSDSLISSTLFVIGEFEVPVVVIPGNHDFGGPGSFWMDDNFQKEAKTMAPNLIVALEETPIVLDNKAVIFPCPLLKQNETRNLLSWINDEVLDSFNSDLPKIVLAHGSIHGFESTGDSEHAINDLNLNSLNLNKIDFVALGDWHGTKKINDKTWYSGTHEIDRFPKGDNNNPGNVLIVELLDKNVNVDVLHSSQMKWHTLSFKVYTKDDLNAMFDKINEVTALRVNQDLLHLTVDGVLGLDDLDFFQAELKRVKARLIRVKDYINIEVKPSHEELIGLCKRNSDELTRNVAQKLVDKLSADNSNDAEIASLALRALYLEIKNN